MDEIKRSSEKEGELIVAEAKTRAQHEIENTRREAEKLRAEIEELRQLRTNYFIRIRAMVKSQADLLSAMEKEQNPEIADDEKPLVF